MPSPRNSRFTENFDDDDESDPPSSESLASAPSPEQSSDPSLEQLAQTFSAIRLSSAPHSSNQQQQGGTMQPQAPKQIQASGITQNNESSTIAAETSSDKAEAGVDEHQEFDPEEAPEEEISGLPTEQGTPQHKQYGAVEESSAKTANVFLHQLFDEVLREQSITPEEMRHASNYIHVNFKELEQDLEAFAERRLYVSAKLQRWFAIHQLEGSWDTQNPCLSCLLLFNKIDRLYFAACANIRDMMAVLEKGLRASALLFEATHKHVADQTQDQTLGEFCAPLLQNLESTERMLQALEDDAEKRKGWPQASLSEQPSATASRPESDGDQENHSEGDNTKAEVNADSAAITDPKVNEVFGDKILLLKNLLQVFGIEDGQVFFAMDPKGDVSAQQWFQFDGHWFNIGHFSRSLRRIEGTLASHRLTEETEPRIHALPQNSLEYFKAVAKQHEA